jgi:hypothetical protein
MQKVLSDVELEPELRRCCDEAKRITLAAENLVRNLTDAQLGWKPEPGVWSIALCLEHLAVTARADLPFIRRAISEGRSAQLFGHGPFRYGVFGRLLTRVMGAPARIKFKAPAVYRPGEQTHPRQAVDEFFLRQREIQECIQDANGLHLARTKMSIHGHEYLKLSIGQGFILLMVHEQRHLVQAERVRSHPRFP